MRTIVLVGSGRIKGTERTWADQLYSGTAFRLRLRYAWSLQPRPHRIYILSPRHHLVHCYRDLAPYKQSLSALSPDQRRDWGRNVLNQLQRVSNLKRDHFIILAGSKYCEPLIEHLHSYKEPLKGLSIKEQNEWIKKELAKDNAVCKRLHQLCLTLPRHDFSFDKKDVPKNGVYIMFEKGERGHGGERIVRIGSHTGMNRLPRRLKTHPEDTGASILRNHIGDTFSIGCDLNKGLLERQTYKAILRGDNQKEITEIRKQVSAYIRDNFSFVTIERSNPTTSLELEEQLIATVAQCTDCSASKNWLGRHSTKPKIRHSGLWQINHLNSKSMSRPDLNKL